MADARTPVAALLVLVLALLACKSKSDPAPAPSPPPAAPTASGPCPTGASVDPGQGEFRPAVTAFQEKQYATAQLLLDNMMTKYPNSATVRVWRGDAALFDNKVKELTAADNSLPFYEEALKIHGKGCALPESEHYYLRMGFAYAYLRKKDGAKALEHLEPARKQWDNSAEVFYNAARAKCLDKDLEGCVADFEKSLEIAKSLRRPKFLRTHRSLDDWIRRSRTQSEFPALRRDPRYNQILKKMRDDD